MSRILLGMLLVAAIAAGLALAADVVVGGDLASRQSDLARQHQPTPRPAARRAERGSRATRACCSTLASKRETPATVIVLEALSEILPDDTYVTELRVEGTKLQIIGVTHDAPGLIRLIEQSPHFTHATFFAPTIRAPTDPRRPLSHRGADRARQHAAVMTMDHRLDRLLARFPALATLAYFVLVVALLGGRLSSRPPICSIAGRPWPMRKRELAQLDRGRADGRGAGCCGGRCAAGLAVCGGPDGDARGRRAAAARRRRGDGRRRQRALLAGRRERCRDEVRAGQPGGERRGEPTRLAEAALRSRSRHALPVRRPLLVVQVPDNVARGEGGRLRIVLSVSGQWRGGK